MKELHERSVDWFTERGEAAARAGACPLETWARDLRAYVERTADVLMAVHQLPAGEARGMAMAELISGRPGSWESAEIIAMVRADFTPFVEVHPADSRALAPLLGEWPARRIDGGQVLADALARLCARSPVVPEESHFAGSSLARSGAV